MSARLDAEVIVVGGGPAGVAAALSLRRQLPRAARVLLLDAQTFPRDKPCGGALTGRALEALGLLGLSLRVPATFIEEAHFWCGPVRQRVALPRPVAVVWRRQLDADLLEQARRQGVEVLEGVRVRRLTGDVGGVTLGCSSGALRARVVVGADGAAGLCRRFVEDSPDGRGRPPIRLLHAVEPLAARPGSPDMVYDLGPTLDGRLSGYAWWFRSPRGINLGAMHVPAAALPGRGPGNDLSDGEVKGERLRQESRALGAELCDDLPPLAFHGWPAPTYDATLPLARHGVLLAGDAAGLDPLTGEGLSFALEDGPLVAATLAEHLAGDPQALTGHSRRRRRSPAGRSLAARCFLAGLLYRWPQLGLPVAADRAVLELLAGEISGNRPLVLAKARALLTLLGAIPGLAGWLTTPRRSASATRPRRRHRSR